MKSNAQMMPVLGVETSVVNEVHTTANNVASGEGRTIRLSGAGRTERMTVVSMITIGLLIPA